MGAKENDLNPNVYIGLKLPLMKNELGYFKQTKTTLEQAVHNIKNLLLTIPGERVAQPEFGSRLHHILFEQIDSEEQLFARVKDVIKEAIKIWLPYVIIDEINVAVDNRLQNNLNIAIKFSITLDPNRFETITFNIAAPLI